MTHIQARLNSQNKEARTANRRLGKVAVQFSADTFVVKIATFAKRQNVSSNGKKPVPK